MLSLSKIKDRHAPLTLFCGGGYKAKIGAAAIRIKHAAAPALKMFCGTLGICAAYDLG